MLTTVIAQRAKIGLALAVLGAALFFLTFFGSGAGVWLMRMLALIMVAGGTQWLPKAERWLHQHAKERVLIATVLGVALVWMLVQYQYA